MNENVVINTRMGASMMNERSITFKSKVRNKVNDDEKFAITMNDILGIMGETFPIVNYEPASAERKFSEAEVAQIIARTGLRDTRKQITQVADKQYDDQSVLNDYINSHTQPPLKVSPETYIALRNSIPKLLVPKSIDMDKLFSSVDTMINAIIDDIDSLTDINIDNDNAVTALSYIPFGFYTDFDGGVMNNRSPKRSYEFADTKTIVSKSKYDEIHIVPKNISAMNWLNEVAVNGVDTAINKIDGLNGWQSKRFISVIIENSVKKYTSLNHYGLNTSYNSSVQYIRYTAII